MCARSPAEAAVTDAHALEQIRSSTFSAFSQYQQKSDQPKPDKEERNCCI
jgi:hypothetical protein